MPTYRLDIAYDGTGFSGWAVQPGKRTVQGEIEADPGMLGDIGRALARARWAEGEPEAARAAAREAIDAYTRGGDDEQLAEVRRWLAEHSEASR